MPDHDHGVATLFDPYAPFSREVSQPSSVGLGLYVSRRLMDLMGGSLDYERRDERSVFEITLPSAAPHLLASDAVA